MLVAVAGDLTLSKAIMTNLMQRSCSLRAVPNQYTHFFSQPTEHAQCEVLLLKHFDVHVPHAVGYTGVTVYLSARLDLQGPSQLPISYSPCMQFPREAELRQCCVALASYRLQLAQLASIGRRWEMLRHNENWCTSLFWLSADRKSNVGASLKSVESTISKKILVYLVLCSLCSSHSSVDKYPIYSQCSRGAGIHSTL